MCQECGCSAAAGEAYILGNRGAVPVRDRSTESVHILRKILAQNDLVAGHNRAHLEDRGILAINLMSSPGSGKTSLLEATIDALAGKWRVAVIEGDLETENDAARIRARGIPAVQITTGQTCHLDASMVHDALHTLELANIDILFIENVGNLVCPAGYDLGQRANVTLLSVTEGDDKPSKYPVMFREADLVLVSKIDLLEVLDDFVPERAVRNVRALANPAGILQVSARKPTTLAPWLVWLEEQLSILRSTPSDACIHHGHKARPLATPS